MKPDIFFKILIIVFISTLFSSLSHGKTQPSQEKIKIVVNDWSSQIAMAKIYGKILEKKNYKIEYIPLTTTEQWGMLSRGKAHVQVEVWEGTMAHMFNWMVSNGTMADAGTHHAKTREEWWYPDYVEEKCPGLPDWRALKKCYKIFATPETAPKGRYLGGPWEAPDAAMVKALDLNFIIIKAKNGNELRYNLDEAVKNKIPIVLFNWTPNWVEIRYKGKFVEFPEHSPLCESNPRWGINPKLPYDCGNPKNGWLKKAAWAGMENKWPCAYEILKKMNFTGKMIAELSFWIDINKMPYEIAADKWLEDYDKVWKGWLCD